MVSIKSLTLTNFRNHQILDLQFGDRINLIIGGNAKGKTNLLESIYFMGRGKSFRGGDHRDVISWGKCDCKIEAEIEKRGGSARAFAYLDLNQKKLRLDGKDKNWGLSIGVVLFTPQDVTIFRDSPQARRSYLDNVILGLERDYRLVHREYLRVLAQKNRVLKEGGYGLSCQIEVWNERLVETGAILIAKRISNIDKMNNYLSGVYSYMGGVGEGAKILYKVSIKPRSFSKEDIVEAFYERLREKEAVEKIRGVSVVGPHRDDWRVEVEGRDLGAFGSQGQMRVMAISMKVVELMLNKQIWGETPILMLDDVISELDSGSAEKLLGFINKMDGQVFITSTGKDMFEQNLRDACVITVSA